MKSAFEKRARTADIKPGAILYVVNCVTGFIANMGSKQIITSFPYDTLLGTRKAKFVRSICIFESGDECKDYFSLDDRNVGDKSQYNFHALFKSKEDAQAYIDEINNGQLFPEHRKLSLKLQEQQNRQTSDFFLW